MKCQNCGENEANFRYTEIINGDKKEIALCDKCSKELGIQGLDFNMPIDFSSFFGDFLNEYEDTTMFPIGTISKKLKCDNCNMTYDEFQKTGKFGCSNCYSIFDSKVEPLLKRIQGETRYLGRKSKENKPHKYNEDTKSVKETTENEDEITKLKKELKQLIREEKYEDAAVVRDKIKKLENN